jgi:hypothetical protein
MLCMYVCTYIPQRSVHQTNVIEVSEVLIAAKKLKYCYVKRRCVTYRRVFDWMIESIDNLYIQLGVTDNTALTLIYTLCSTPLHTHTHTLGFSGFTSHILATDFNTVGIPVSHVKSTLHSLILFLPLFCSINFVCHLS